MLSAIKFTEKSNLTPIILSYFCRNGHTLRGKPPGVARTLEQRLADENPVDPELSKKINIGFPQMKVSRSKELFKRLEHMKKQRVDPELEKLSKTGKLQIDLDSVHEEWLKTSGPLHIKRIAEHYKIFEHLFGDAYFVPRVAMDIKYNLPDGETQAPVYYGNLLTPSDTQTAPEVTFDASFSYDSKPVDPSKTLWTLLMTGPDGHLEQENSEYVHWLITNIPGNDVSKGECLVPYLQAFPPKGTGYHRFVFLLFKQEKKLDLSSYKVTEQFNLKKRTFSTPNFYKKFQDDITPAGLSFFQADYDASLTDFFHKKLDMKEPIYEYDFPKPYYKDQIWFPHKSAFNEYMDRYRDDKQINKEFLQRKLKEVNPFEAPPPPLRFPHAHPIKGVPSWYKTELEKQRMDHPKIKEINKIF
ncbi:large ribosomal subunit protein mL38 [Culicoides brevitarsis]|uniref:large ribosomal subunit protein mL38 n=1 Tax=Culicoides brevitarsis TaxID=469753 RepID=UPI00307C54B4